MLEEHDCGPVIGEVFRESASRAAALLANITRHVRLEGIPTDDLVQMGGRRYARLDDGIEALNAHSRTSEA